MEAETASGASVIAENVTKLAAKSEDIVVGDIAIGASLAKLS
jgi:hypothetical protein